MKLVGSFLRIDKQQSKFILIVGQKKLCIVGPTYDMVPASSSIARTRLQVEHLLTCKMVQRIAFYLAHLC